MTSAGNYDIVYVRPHTREHCWELGKVEDGMFYGRDFGECDIMLKTVDLAVKIANGKGSLYINGIKKKDFQPFYPAVNKVGTTLRNNMEAKMFVSGFSICQEIDCVSKGDHGIVVTKPGDHYKTKDMSECEACTCRLYGQIQCGCRSAADQGVSCTGGKIPATGADCCARCVPPSGSCHASGDPHYSTFDGRGHHFQGRCTYCMAKTNDFEVRAKNVPWGNGPSVVSYCQILFDGDLYTQIGPLTVKTKEGETKTLATPYKKFYGPDDWIYCSSAQACEIYIGGTWAMKEECRYMWNKITLHGRYYERTHGCLCGPWDGNQGNDFMMANGQIASNWNQFGNSWVRSNTDCPAPPEPVDPCDDRHKANLADQFCARFKREPFKSCPVDESTYFEDCKFDVCTDPSNTEGICSNAEAYAKACEAIGYSVAGWRTSTFCPMECPDTMVFDSCGDGCHATCENPSPSDCKDTCIEGCYCPAGTVLQNNRCVPSTDCKCLYAGDFKETGEEWEDIEACKACSCKAGGIVECNPKACDKCPEGEVPVQYEGSCCPTCVGDWTKETEETITENEGEGPVVLECKLHDDVLVNPDDITWKDKNGNVISPDTASDRFSWDSTNTKLTINPVEIGDATDYVAEVLYKGIVGTCQFTLIVEEESPVSLIDIIGDSPKTVKEGECITMSVEVNPETTVELSANDFTWKIGPGAEKPDGKRVKVSDDGKSITICDAQLADETTYTVCAESDGLVDCEDIDLIVLVRCVSEEGPDHFAGETWKEGEFTECTCEVTGSTNCECIEQEVDCNEATHEIFFDENCEKRCVVKPGTCTITGDPHYKGFDGTRHDFQGACRFTLAQTKDFSVVGTNGHRFDNNEVSWTDSVEVNYKTSNIYLGPDGEVKVNGQTIVPTWEKDYRKGDFIKITKAGSKIIVNIHQKNDAEALYLEWDGNSTVSTTIHGQYFEGTSGLCGNWDGDDSNDLDPNPNGGTHGKDELSQFGWSWANPNEGETCEEKPTPPHPCDEALFPEAAPIADEACDVLKSAPFTNCNGKVDMESVIANCKYDVCSCYDNSCACPVIKTMVAECQENGGQGLDEWRESASWCPMECKSPFQYESCGSNCQATCQDPEPDCGKNAGKCNEGCFCPKGMVFQDETCIDVSECQCEYNGEIKNVNDIWTNKDTCKECVCEDKGKVVCAPVECEACDSQSLPIYEDQDACCPVCTKDWLTTETPLIEDVEAGSSLNLKCSSEADILTKNKQWFYSKDGKDWEPVENSNTFNLKVNSVTEDGFYKCTGKKKNKKAEAIIEVKLAEKPAGGCEVTPPENSGASKDTAQAGEIVEYACEKGFGREPPQYDTPAKATCGDDGNLDPEPSDCIQKITIKPKVKFNAKKKSAKVTCVVTDIGYDKKSKVDFVFYNADGGVMNVKGKSKTKSKKGKTTFTFNGKGITESGTVWCSSKNKDGSAIAYGMGKFTVKSI